MLPNVAIPLFRDNLPGLVSKTSLNAVNKFKRKIIRKRVVRAGKIFIWFVSNGDMNDIIKIIKLQQDFGVLIDGVTKKWHMK